MLELAAFIPSAPIAEYEQLGITNAALRVTDLCKEITFVAISSEDIFSMHDLFRDFVRRQISLRGTAAVKETAQKAASLLVRSERYIDALQVILDAGTSEELMRAIENVPIRLDDSEIATKLVAATERLSLSDLMPGTLELQTDYWARCGFAKKAFHYAEELLTCVRRRHPGRYYARRAS